MENIQCILKNKPLPRNIECILEKLIGDGEKILFVIVGDLNLKGKYEETALIFTRNFLISYNGEGSEKRFEYSEMKDVKAKRMYGNATLSAVMPDGQREVIFRYTYSVAALCDASALFINHINEGADFGEENAIMHVTFERALSVCPKCGRNLLHPGAECIKCRSKLKVLKRLVKYITPQYKPLVISVVLSLVTTVMSLVPPTITGFIVDVVFGGKEKSSIGILNLIADVVGGNPSKLLTAMILCLLLTYILQYGIGTIRAYLMRIVGNKMVTALRNDIYRKAQHLPMKFYDKTSTGAVINRIASDSNTLNNLCYALHRKQ